MERIFKAWGMSYLRGCVLQLVVSIVVVALSVPCIFVPLYFANNTRNNTAAFWIMVIPMSAFVLILLGGSLGVGLFFLMRRASQLDEAFKPLGLEGKMYLTNGRQYHGTVQGRRVDIYFYRGPTLEIFVEATIKSRIGIGVKSSVGAAVAGMINRQPLELGDADYAPFSIYANDSQWARDIFADPTFKQAAIRLATNKTSYGLYNLIIAPGGVQIQRRYISTNAITPESVREWINDLIAVARIVEAQPAPQKVEEESASSRKMRVDRDAFNLPWMLGTIGFFVMMALCFGGIIIAVVALTTGK
ncbi:MAG: hypothetical protein AAB261_04420 [Chloroflexota bacterium]